MGQTNINFEGSTDCSPTFLFVWNLVFCYRELLLAAISKAGSPFELSIRSHMVVNHVNTASDLTKFSKHAQRVLGLFGGKKRGLAIGTRLCSLSLSFSKVSKQMTKQ